MLLENDFHQEPPNIRIEPRLLILIRKNPFQTIHPAQKNLNKAALEAGKTNPIILVCRFFYSIASEFLSIETVPFSILQMAQASVKNAGS